MHLASDYVHRTPHRGRCRVRIYVPDSAEDSHVVVITELADNPGQSVTNCIEQLAAEVIQANVLPSSKTVVIEHYESAARGGDGETYDLVTFSERDPDPVLRAGVSRLELGDHPGRRWIRRASRRSWVRRSGGRDACRKHIRSARPLIRVARSLIEKVSGFANMEGTRR